MVSFVDGLMTEVRQRVTSVTAIIFEASGFVRRGNFPQLDWIAAILDGSLSSAVLRFSRGIAVSCAANLLRVAAVTTRQRSFYCAALRSSA